MASTPLGLPSLPASVGGGVRGVVGLLAGQACALLVEVAVGLVAFCQGGVAFCLSGVALALGGGQVGLQRGDAGGGGQGVPVAGELAQPDGEGKLAPGVSAVPARGAVRVQDVGGVEAAEERG